MKILALDLGDRWVGSAISDGLGISCKPYQTVELEQLEEFLTRTLVAERISTVVVGYPKTVSSGTESDQTKKIVATKEALELKFADVNGQAITWVLWDERLSSKRAAQGKLSLDKDAKMKSHSVAAAFILQTYLDYLAFQKSDF
jgi:putative Holliday junction resolvase